MTKQHRQDFALGLATIMFVALFITTLLFLRPLFKTQGRPLQLQFRADLGMAPLEKGSPVLLGGALQVGRVQKVNLGEAQVDTPAGPQSKTIFLVTVELDNDVPLYGDCVITTGQPAIGGSGYVQISDVGTPGEPLSEPLIGRPPQSFSAAIAQLSDQLLGDAGLVTRLNRSVDPEAEGSLMYKTLASLADINAVTHGLRGEFALGNDQALLAKLHAILNDVNGVTASLRHDLGTEDADTLRARVLRALDLLERSLSETAALIAEDRPLVRDTLTNLKEATAKLDQDVLARVKAELDAGDPQSVLGRVHVAMDRLNASLANIQTISATGQQLVSVNRVTLENTLLNFQSMSEQLRLASQEVLLNPSKLIWGPQPQRQEQLVVFQAARNFAEAAARLDDAAARLQGILAAAPEGQTSADPAEVKVIFDGVRAAFDRFEQAERVLWDQLK